MASTMSTFRSNDLDESTIDMCTRCSQLRFEYLFTPLEDEEQEPTKCMYCRLDRRIWKRSFNFHSIRASLMCIVEKWLANRVDPDFVFQDYEKAIPIFEFILHHKRFQKLSPYIHHNNGWVKVYAPPFSSSSNDERFKERIIIDHPLPSTNPPAEPTSFPSFGEARPRGRERGLLEDRDSSEYWPGSDEEPDDNQHENEEVAAVEKGREKDGKGGKAEEDEKGNEEEDTDEEEDDVFGEDDGYMADIEDEEEEEDAEEYDGLGKRKRDGNDEKSAGGGSCSYPGKHKQQKLVERPVPRYRGRYKMELPSGRPRR